MEASLADDGEFRFSDGTTVYTMRSDHSFEAGPVGTSGQTIRGRWCRDENRYEVFGHWGWMNGGSRADDFRRLRFDLRPPFVRVPPEELPLHGNSTVYRAPFVVDALAPITPAEHEAGLRRCGGS